MDASVAAGLNAAMLKLALAALSVFIGGLFAYAVGREIVATFQTQPAGLVIDDAISAVGSLRWVDTTLVTGLAAVAAAYLSVRAVRDQIQQTAEIEKDRTLARRTAVRASLGLALSSVSDYATTCAHLNHDLLLACDDHRLPEGVDLPVFPEVPDGAVSTIREMIEFAEPSDRRAFAKIAPAIQVQSARLRGMARDLHRGSRPNQNNLLEYTIDAIEIYARCASLFDYSRDKPDAVARPLAEGDIVRSIHNISLFSVLDSELRRTAVRRERQLATTGQL